MLRKPISVMKKKVKSLLSDTAPEALSSSEIDDLKFMLYSGHDD